MAMPAVSRSASAVRPLHAVLLGGALALFLGALLGDIAYARSYEIQWANFAAWLVVGGLVVAALALVCALLAVLAPRRARADLLHALLLAAAWIAGFFNALMHARDAWAVMPGGLVLSAITLVLLLMAAWIGLHAPRAGGVA